MFFGAMALFASCDKEPLPEPEPEPGPGPEVPTELTFEVNIGTITKSDVTFSITPSIETAEYLALVVPETIIDETGVGSGLVTAIIEDLKATANAAGKSFAEYMPTVVDKGNVTDRTVGMLSYNTDYSLVIFGVDGSNNYAATTEPFCHPFTTADLQMEECTFEVTPTVNGTEVSLEVVPSNKEIHWHLELMESAMYDAYTDPEYYNMTTEEFYNTYLANEISQLSGAGYTTDQIIAALFPQGDQTMEASSLVANAEYTYMVAGIGIEGDSIYVITTITKGEFTSGDVAMSDLTFDIQLSNPEFKKFDVLITPSDLNETFTWIVQEYDGVSTVDEVAERFLANNKSWLDQGWMLYTGVQDYTEAGPNYKFSVDSPDTEYSVLVMGYSGGVTTAPVMKTIRTLPAPDPAEATFEMTISDVSAYGFTMNIDASDETTYYFCGAVPSDLFNAEEAEAEMETYLQEALAEMQAWDPSYTIVDILSQSAWEGDYAISPSQAEPNTTYTVYILAMNMDGTAAKMHTWPEIVTTGSIGVVAPTMELLGYYSGDEEAGQVFGDAGATAGRAIAAIKYNNVDAATALYMTSSYDMTWVDTTQVSDSYIYNNAYSWSSIAPTTPYTFLLLWWDSPCAVVAYAEDADGNAGPMARLETNANAENKSDIQELLDLVNELNSQAKVYSPLRENIDKVPYLSGILTKENSEHTFTGTVTKEVEIPETIARPEMVAPAMFELEENSVRALRHVSFFRTK